ncbi:hypothetical protein GP486_003195 [Trichoglossum hirsutum]|uniref:U6 snRNA phosphodiesterase n=1 Tax=Trichoglossum hirsutum TaxID=265104 RepID=A0A9P8LDQ7_9PEZI|nr:hypothetical protein GP486_003195 [Trichoglossum hirsutum]
MVLVDYSDSDDGGDAVSSPPPSTPLGKRKRVDRQSHLPSEQPERSAALPPLPSRFHDLYVSASRIGTNDDPSLHGGRMRAIPHVEGNWATHVYLEWHPNQAESDSLTSLLLALQGNGNASLSAEPEIHSLLSSDLGAPLPLHISLSRPIVLTTERRQHFAGSLREAIVNSGVRPFNVRFTTFGWVPNYENTRWFLTLRTAKPTNDELNRLLRPSNRVVTSFGQAPLYEPEDSPTAKTQRGNVRGRWHGSRGFNKSAGHRRGLGRVDETQLDCSSHFHVSLGWSPKEPPSEMANRMRSAAVLARVNALTAELAPSFEAVKVKVGNAVTVVPLQTQAKEGTGLIGLC